MKDMRKLHMRVLHVKSGFLSFGKSGHYNISLLDDGEIVALFMLITKNKPSAYCLVEGETYTATVSFTGNRPKAVTFYFRDELIHRDIC